MIAPIAATERYARTAGRGGLRAATLLVLGALAVAGCRPALDLQMPPTITDTSTNIGKGRTIVLTTPFADARQIKERCGMLRDGLGADSADYFCSEPPAEWIADFLVAELRDAGFHVVTSPTALLDDPLMVNGELLLLFAESFPQFVSGLVEADIHVRLTARNAQGLEARRDFYAKGEAREVMTDVPAPRYFAEALRRAAEQIIPAMSAAIADLSRRYY